MAKIDPLTTITSGFNSTAQLNENFTKITDALTNTLSRDGSTPNQMDAVIDMNSNRIINLADPVDNQDAVTKIFFEAAISGDVDLAAGAASAAAALVSETNAAISAAEAVEVENSQIVFTFDSSTSMADPGTGNLRYNNSTVSSVTEIAFDALMAQTGDPDVSDYIATWDDSTNTVTGHVTLIKRGNAEVFAIFNVTSVADNTGWLQVTVTHVSSSGTLSASDKVDIQFARAGDIGGTLVSADITGQTGATVALGDSFVFTDVGDSDNLKKDTVQGIVDLASAGVTTGLVLLTTATANNSSSVDFISGITSTYDEYELHVIECVPATDNASAYLRTDSSGGASFDSASNDYFWNMVHKDTGGGNVFGSQAGGAAQIELTKASAAGNAGVGSAAGESFNSVIKIYAPSSSATKTLISFVSSYYGPGGELSSITGNGSRDDAAIIDALRFLFSTGDIASGKFKLYGVKK